MIALHRLSRVTLLLATLAAAQVEPARPPVEVTARVDRPALWVADRVTYTIELVCPRGFDILVEDLGRDRLKLTGLDVVSTSTTRRQEADATRYIADYVLTTYRVDVPTPSMGSFPVRYYMTRAGQRPEEAAPAGSVLVPAVSVAFRSLLPDDEPEYEARDPRAVPARWIGYRIMEPVGIGLILVSMVPAALLLMGLVRAIRARSPGAGRPPSRQTRQALRVAFDEIRTLDPVNAEARRDAFARLDGMVRQYVAEVCGVAASGLTPDEIAAAIEPCATRLPPELVASVLASCELARYAAAELQPTIEAWQHAVGQAEQLMFGGR